MARALVGAASSVASFTLVAFEALAHTRSTIADSPASALSIAVELTISVRAINPGNLEWADTVRAISRLH